MILCKSFVKPYELQLRDKMYIHEYFSRKHTEWSITGFLNECNEEPFRFKVDIYLKSLVNIINSDQGRKREKAKALYVKSRMVFEKIFLLKL